MAIPTGIPQIAIKRGQNTGPASYDTSGTAYLPSGEASVTVVCGYLDKNSLVSLSPTATSTVTIPLMEVSASRTYGSSGNFVVKLQDASTAGADLFFNWLVRGI